MQVHELPLPVFKGLSLQGCRYRSDSSFAIPLPPELDRAVAKRRADFAAGRWCAQQLYKRLLIQAPLPVYRGQASPLWPEGWQGSISHTWHRGQGFALAAMSSQHPYLGVDIELQMPHEKAQSLRRSILHRDEEGLDNTLLTLAFSFKESLYKGLWPHLQRFIAFDEVAITGIEGQYIYFEPRGPLQQDFPTGAPRRGHRVELPDQPELVLTLYGPESLS